MKAFLTIVAVVLLLALVGWITFQATSHRFTIGVETDRIERDVDHMSDAVEDLSHELQSDRVGQEP